jgi:hypothetical protein
MTLLKLLLIQALLTLRQTRAGLVVSQQVFLLARSLESTTLRWIQLTLKPPGLHNSLHIQSYLPRRIILQYSCPLLLSLFKINKVIGCLMVIPIHLGHLQLQGFQTSSLFPYLITEFKDLLGLRVLLVQLVIRGLLVAQDLQVQWVVLELLDCLVMMGPLELLGPLDQQELLVILEPLDQQELLGRQDQQDRWVALERQELRVSLEGLVQLV